MNFREVFCWSFLTFLLLECLFVRCVNSLPARDTLTVEATQASAAQTIKIESTTSNHKGVEEKPSSGFQNDVEGNANLTEVKGDGGFTWFPRGFLNWIYPNPSILKQNFYRWFFNGIIMGGVFVQYDTVKRQILVTLAKVLTQFKKEKAERDKIRQEAQLYDNSYNNQYPDGYQNQEPEYQPSLENGYEDKPAYQPSDSEIKEEQLIYIPSDGDNKKEQPAYQPSDGGNKEVQPAYQPPEGDVKGEKPEYQPSVVAFEKEKPEYQSSDDEIEKDRPVYQPTDGDTENEKIDYQLIEKRSQHLGGEYSINTNVDASSVRERLIGLTDKVCFQKSLCQLEKLSSISPSMARLWFEVSNFFSSSVWENRLQSQNKHIMNCEVEFRACQVSTLELIKYLLQQ